MNSPLIPTGMKCMAVLLTLGLLAACGSKDSPGTAATQKPAARQKAGSEPPRDATAAEVAAEARGKLKCPVKSKLAPRAANAPVDDIVGVRPGMGHDEAAATVLCTHDLLVVTEDARGRFQINTYGEKLRQGFGARFAEPRVHVQKTARDYARDLQYRDHNRAAAQIPPGTARWYVGTMGVPGEERVVHAAREEGYEEGRNPTIASVVEALVGKYGPLTERAGQQGSGEQNLTWANDPFGRRITETSPLFRQCNAIAHFGAALSFSPDCGIVVAARIVPVRENPALAGILQVVVVDQAGAYEALQKTEQWFAQQDAARRAKEVEAAGRNAGAPTL